MVAIARDDFDSMAKFLRDATDDPPTLGAEFNGVRRPEGVLDLEQFAPLCGFLQ